MWQSPLTHIWFDLIVTDCLLQVTKNFQVIINDIILLVPSEPWFTWYKKMPYMKHLAPFQCLCFTQDTKIQSKKHSVLYCRSVYYNASIICAWWIKKTVNFRKLPISFNIQMYATFIQCLFFSYDKHWINYRKREPKNSNILISLCVVL